MGEKKKEKKAFYLIKSLHFWLDKATVYCEVKKNCFSKRKLRKHGYGNGNIIIILRGAT